MGTVLVLNPIMELVFKANVGPGRVLEPGPELVGLIPESDAVLIPRLGSVLELVPGLVLVLVLVAGVVVETGVVGTLGLGVVLALGCGQTFAHRRREM